MKVPARTSIACNLHTPSFVSGASIACRAQHELIFALMSEPRNCKESTPTFTARPQSGSHRCVSCQDRLVGSSSHCSRLGNHRTQPPRKFTAQSLPWQTQSTRNTCMKDLNDNKWRSQWRRAGGGNERELAHRTGESTQQHLHTGIDEYGCCTPAWDVVPTVWCSTLSASRCAAAGGDQRHDLCSMQHGCGEGTAVRNGGL